MNGRKCSALNTPEMETTWIFDYFDGIVQHKYISLMSLLDLDSWDLVMVDEILEVLMGHINHSECIITLGK